ncbi:MAG TPA: Nramp family divalent metal transporter [Candidatus Saccharimonadales bacterium]|nr:Nramp family divalent metal transporter [Candidatus Saccharimonadales bacterium]
MSALKSLSEVHRSITLPPSNASFIRKLLAFTGPGYMVAVGYMDPGNWATDLAGGSAFGYTLLFVILLSSIFAMFLQHLTVKLGIVTGKDLAQICRQVFPKWVNVGLWLIAELMIIACDLAEVIGTAIALELLFGIPLAIGVVITALDVLLLLFLQKKGFRWLEALVIALIAIVVVCFGLELFFSQPEIAPLLAGFIPARELFTNQEMLFIAVGILGATVMPHNLYLHSAVVQTRAHEVSKKGKKEAIKFATIDSSVALTIALFVNASILILAAATFLTTGHNEVAEIDQAYQLLAPLLGVGIASVLFAVALLASGQNSTITATLAGQIILEGFMNIKIKPWLRRLLTRSLAIIPAVIIAVMFQGSGLSRLLIFSQIVLSLQLPFAILPLVYLTSSKKHMGDFANKLWLKIVVGLIAAVIVALNVWLIVRVFAGE